MTHPWANVLILLLGAIELSTGLLGLINGSPGWVSALNIHRVCGFGLVALLLWKGRNILASLARLRRGRGIPAAHLGSVALLSLLLASLGLGLAWSHAGRFSFAGFSGVSWHIYLSLAITPLLLWHTLRRRWALRPRFWAERRSALRLAGLAVAGLALWRVGEAANQVFALPGRDRRFTGSYERGSFSGNAFPATSWLNDNPRPLDPEGWSLSVGGHVQSRLRLDHQHVEGYRDRLTATLDCTGGWHSTQEWDGVQLKTVLERAGVRPDAGSVTVRSVTGYARRFSMEEAQGYLLATRVGGEPLSHRHGFPLRLVAPGKRGYDWVKWVTAVEVNDTGKWWQPPLPLT